MIPNRRLYNNTTIMGNFPTTRVEQNVPVVSDENMSKTQLSKHVDDSLHGCVIRNSNGCEIQNAAQFYRWWGRGVHLKTCIEENQRVVADVILFATYIAYTTS